MEYQRENKGIRRPVLALLLAVVLIGGLLPPAFAATEEITVTLDGVKMYPAYYGTGMPVLAEAEMKDDRVMVPIRYLVEAMGGIVTWNEDTWQVTITRAGDTIVLTIDSNVAICNGEALQMDVAPYISDSVTLLPTRYIAEFFGQKVEWDEESLTVSVTEDRDAVGSSNLERWALPMGAMLSEITGPTSPERFGGAKRFTNYLIWGYQYGRKVLSDSWSVGSREDLIDTVQRMTLGGHNTSFGEYTEFIGEMSSTEFQQFLGTCSDEDKEMFLYTKTISDKWGDKGILCWDLFRMSNLVQWGYVAGYLTYPEALDLLEPASSQLQQNFSSWDEAYENYLHGYHWWARTPVTGSIWDTERGTAYQKMKEDESKGKLFDDSLFTTGVIGVQTQP